MSYSYETSNRYAYCAHERAWFDAMIDARNENRPFSFI
jgi:hypothetical protein